MLEDAPGLINPIIHAMVESKQRQQQVLDRAQKADQLKQDAAYKQAELKHQDAQLAELQREHDQSNQYQTDMLNKVHLPLAKAQIDKQHLDQQQQMMQLLKGGATQNPDGGLTLPSGPDALKAEADEIQQKAGAQATGTQTALQPFLDNAEKRREDSETKKLQQDHANKLEEMVKKGEIDKSNAREYATIHGNYELANIRLAGENHLKGIMLGMGGDANGADRANQLLKSIYSGQTDYKDLPTNDKKLVDGYTAGTGETVPTNGKDYKAALDRVGSMQELLNRARELAINNSRDSAGGSTLNKITGGHIPALVGSGVFPGTDLDSKIKDFNAFGGQLVKQLEGMNRTSDQDRIRQTIGAFDPAATKEQNLAKINSRVLAMQQVLKNDTVGLPTDRINKVLGDRGITDFGLKPKVSAIKMPDGSLLPDTPQNRQKAGIQ